MAAWCQNSEVIVGPVREVAILYLDIYRWLQEYEPEFSGVIPGTSLSNVLQGAGLESLPCNSGVFAETPDLRRCNDNSNQALMVFVTETPWEPIPEAWREIVRLRAPHCQYYYISVCDETNQFCKYDPTGEYFPEKYYINGMQDDPERFSKALKDICGVAYEEEDLLQLLRKVLQQDTNLQDMIQTFNNVYCFDSRDDSDGENYLHVYEFEEEEV